MQQPMMYRINQDEPGFDLAQAVRAPVPRQIAAPVPNDVITGQGRIRLVLATVGNVLGGGLLLALLLALPMMLGRILGVG
jgi:hypothetical protein